MVSNEANREFQLSRDPLTRVPHRREYRCRKVLDVAPHVRWAQRRIDWMHRIAGYIQRNHFAYANTRGGFLTNGPSQHAQDVRRLIAEGLLVLSNDQIHVPRRGNVRMLTLTAKGERLLRLRPSSPAARPARRA